MSVKSDFADIYSRWEKLHDEGAAISKRAKADNSSDTPVADLTINELRKMKVQDELDLHNVLLDEAVTQTKAFLESSHAGNLRKVRIITGKGLHSPNGVAVLRPEVLKTVRNSSFVSSVDTNPKACEGGSGALIVLLKK